jgi:response regulator of citrate/malate metabolism
VITTLVVDDDFRVAHIHAACINSVEGFTCVGEAHSAAQARELVGQAQPDLLLLDIYLPDEDGLSLLRSFTAELRPPPDCIFITAARDLDSVQEAIGLGAMYYLVKPFGLDQLRERLDHYRLWRSKLTTAAGGEADQSVVDELYASRHAPSAGDVKPRLSPTMARVLDVVRSSPSPMSAAIIASTVGISRPTAQRYLTDLERRGLLELHLEYGATGRPVHRYRYLGARR